MTVVNRYTGRVFEQVGDLSPDLQHAIQSVIVIVTTPVLTRFWNRAFGCGLAFLIDETINDELSLLAAALITEAVERHEDRVLILGVNIQDQEAFNGEIKIDIDMLYVPENRVLTLQGVVVR
jgi:phage baseplate assembly protein W